MANLRCVYPQHAAQSAQPGWDDGVLATGPAGNRYLCLACHRVMTAARNAQEEQDLTQLAQALGVGRAVVDDYGLPAADLRRLVRILGKVA